VGSLTVEGMTLKQVEAAIATKYQDMLHRPLVAVSLAAPRPVNVAIAGEIGRPGGYTLPIAENGKFPTVTTLLRQAGGMTQSANPRQVEIRRSQGVGRIQRIQVDLWAFLQTGDIGQDVTLRDGDSLFIPPVAAINLTESAQLATANFATDASQPVSVVVVGEVARPGPYILSRPLGSNSGNTPGGGAGGSAGILPTVTQAIQQAGGIGQLADLRRIEVRRSVRSGETQTVQLNLWSLLQSGDVKQDLVLQQGDTVVIPTATAMNPAEINQLAMASFAPSTIRVNVVGEAINPGAVQVPPNTTLNQALLAAGGFNRRARRSRVTLIRLNANGTISKQTIPIDLARGIDEQGNPLMRNNDIVLIDRSGGARLSDSLDGIASILGRVLNFGSFLR
jgi:polysaccharide biosynthesis/export protein